MESNFTLLSTDLIELIFSHLPISTLLRAAAACKLWRSIIHHPTFPTTALHHHHPWLFLHGLHNTSSKIDQSFAFDPLSDSWFRIPSTGSSSFTGAAGFLFTTNPRFSYSRILKHSWHFTAPLQFSRENPLIGVFHSGAGARAGVCKFIVVSGVRFNGGLVDIGERLAAEIYNPNLNTWEICPPLPADFRAGNSSQSLSSALFKDKFYVFGIYSCFVSSFDLINHQWSEVQTLRPPGILFSFLISCRNKLILAGICNSPSGSSFNLWEINETTMEFSEIAIMPRDLLFGLVESEDDDKFASLKCVGQGDLIYVFNEEYHKEYPACVCEMGDEFGCKWRKVPKLPSPVNNFHKVISFCSNVQLQEILTSEDEHGQG